MLRGRTRERVSRSHWGGGGGGGGGPEKSLKFMTPVDAF